MSSGSSSMQTGVVYVKHESQENVGVAAALLFGSGLSESRLQLFSQS